VNKIWKRLGLLKTFDTVEKTWLAKSDRLSGIQSVNYYVMSGFLMSFRDPNRVHRIRENYQRVTKIRENRPLNQRNQVNTGCLLFSLQKLA